MFDRRYSAAELASHAGLSTETLKFFVKEGVLQPSIQRAKGRGQAHVYNAQDVLGAMSLNAVRLPNAWAKPFSHLVEFWHSTRGRGLTQLLVREFYADNQRRIKGGNETAPEPRVLLVTEKGVVLDSTPAAVMEEHKTPIVYCLNARHFVDQLNIWSTEAQMVGEFQEPGPSGRVPQRRKPGTNRRKKQKAESESVREGAARSRGTTKRGKP
jgi:hypothetical protein